MTNDTIHQPSGDIWETPSVMEKISRLKIKLGEAQYRLQLDAKRRPDGVTITKAERHCIDELFEENEC